MNCKSHSLRRCRQLGVMCDESVDHHGFPQLQRRGKMDGVQCTDNRRESVTCSGQDTLGDGYNMESLMDMADVST